MRRTFDIEPWDGEKILWKGRLTVPLPNCEPVWFENECSGLFKLLAILDRMYRAWQQEQQPSPAEEPK